MAWSRLRFSALSCCCRKLNPVGVFGPQSCRKSNHSPTTGDDDPAVGAWSQRPARTHHDIMTEVMFLITHATPRPERMRYRRFASLPTGPIPPSRTRLLSRLVGIGVNVTFARISSAWIKGPSLSSSRTLLGKKS